MTKLTVICGPTAVGKTDFALSMAKAFDADLISVDSRQIYQGMNIGTGKDIPPNTPFMNQSTFKVAGESYNVGYYVVDNTKVWLCDIAAPNQPFSSAVFKMAFDHAMTHIFRENKQVMLIGGTGYYLKSVINPPATMAIPPDHALRDTLEKLTVVELQQRLHHLDRKRLESMNPSDFANPRRLIRAIEVSLSPNNQTIKQSDYQTNMIGLTAPKPYRADRIKQRVELRINQNFTKELTELQNAYPGFLTLPSGNTLGYQEWGKFLAGEWTREEAMARWIQAEIAYAGRQLTWFNKQSGLTWFDITSENWYAQARKQLERWFDYGTSHA